MFIILSVSGGLPSLAPDKLSVSTLCRGFPKKVTMFSDLDLDARLGLLHSQDFAEFATSQGLEPADALELPEVLTRSMLCVAPVVMDAIGADGEMKEIQIPCGTANSLKCESCAEFSARLRQRQIMRGIEGSEEETTRVYLFTNTAPSWGKVHRASIKRSDEYKVRHLWGHKREKALLTVSRQKGACECKKYHRYDDDVVGTPLNPSTYNYAGEIIWSANLPQLVKSMTRTLRHLAGNHGIDAKSLGILTVFERQNRGSLHAHSLLVVRGNPSSADAFTTELKNGWGTDYCPTAEIPSSRLAWYSSGLIQRRWTALGTGLPATPLKDCIPQVKWKGGELRPGTQFGKIWDLREVSGNRNLDGENDGNNGFKQAAGYLSKYLTKNQQAASPEAMKTYTTSQRVHFMRLRIASAVLTLDVVMWESQKRYFLRKIKDTETQLETTLGTLGMVEADAPEVIELMQVEARLSDDLRHYSSGVRWVEANLENPTMSHPLFNVLFKDDGNEFFSKRVTTAEIVTKAGTYHEQRAARGLSIVINKTLDNLGFTGTLISVSQWGCFLSDLKQEMREWAEANGHIFPEEVEYVLRPDRMREVAVARMPQDKPLSPKLFDLTTIGTVISSEPDPIQMARFLT